MTRRILAPAALARNLAAAEVGEDPGQSADLVRQALAFHERDR